jgi:hypothetical protein
VINRRFAAFFALALLALAGACGERKVPDAEWRFEWSLAGKAVTDVWTDKGATCRDSDNDDENILALLHKSKRAACKKACKPMTKPDEALACRLSCDKEIAIVSRDCTQKTRVLPPPPLFPMH